MYQHKQAKSSVFFFVTGIEMTQVFNTTAAGLSDEISELVNM